MYYTFNIYDYVRMLQKFYHEYSYFYMNLILLTFIIFIIMALAISLIGTRRGVLSIFLYTVIIIVSVGIILSIFYPPFVEFLVGIYSTLRDVFSNLYRYFSTYLHSIGFSRQFLVVYIYHVGFYS